MENKIKAVFVSMVAVLTSWLGALAIPIYLLVGCNVIDYITGLMAAKFRGQEISSYKGIKGIAKKVCMWLLVVVGVMVDVLIAYVVTTLNFDVPFTFIVSCLVCVWICANELISILENVADMDVTIPPFLLPLIKLVKSKAENAGDIVQNNEEGE